MICCQGNCQAKSQFPAVKPFVEIFLPGYQLGDEYKNS